MAPTLHERESMMDTSDYSPGKVSGYSNAKSFKSIQTKMRDSSSTLHRKGTNFSIKLGRTIVSDHPPEEKIAFKQTKSSNMLYSRPGKPEQTFIKQSFTFYNNPFIGRSMKRKYHRAYEAKARIA
jgi:hypothetical protein